MKIIRCKVDILSLYKNAGVYCINISSICQNWHHQKCTLCHWEKNNLPGFTGKCQLLNL